MITQLFTYNWQVRKDWMEWCEVLSTEELLMPRTGGMKTFIHTLYHVIYCEHIWVSQLLGKEIKVKAMESITTLEEVHAFAEQTRELTKEWLEQEEHFRNQTLTLRQRSYPHEKVIYHILTHEVHHIGQLSIWAREINRVPVNSDLLIRDIDFN